jgi:hypothetical protein
VSERARLSERFELLIEEGRKVEEFAPTPEIKSWTERVKVAITATFIEESSPQKILGSARTGTYHRHTLELYIQALTAARSVLDSGDPWKEIRKGMRPPD